MEPLAPDVSWLQGQLLLGPLLSSEQEGTLPPPTPDVVEIEMQEGDITAMV